MTESDMKFRIRPFVTFGKEDRLKSIPGQRRKTSIVRAFN